MRGDFLLYERIESMLRYLLWTALEGLGRDLCTIAYEGGV
jgi:hypothetical protein